jgi:hypothetical protein
MAETDKDPALLQRVRETSDDRERAELAFRSAILAARAGRFTHAEIGVAADLTPARIGQILQATPPTGRLLLAPDPGPAVFCVIEKVEAERGRPAIAKTTVEAVDKLTALAHRYELETRRETVAVGGLTLDLNRPNLIVLFGPRSSPLVAQGISADPVIKWRPDEHGDWYIIDTETRTEYHSQFDSSTDPDLPWPRVCYTHLGRIRRPDGAGSWLCLAGAHSPGVIGATEYLCRKIESLWEETGLSLWSVVVQVTTEQNGAIADTSLITPLYVHGRR